jgi:Leucine-rich repeat (LRR) protein
MLSQLSSLDISNNHISSFQHLPNLFIASLYANNNCFTSFKHFPHILPMLKILQIENNQIASFDDLPYLPSLLWFYISNNCITSIPNRSFSNDISLIDIQNNPIIDCKIHLSNFKKLSIYTNYFIGDDDKAIEMILSRDLEEHKDAIIKNENKEDVLIAKLFIGCISNCNISAFTFAIKNNIYIKLCKDFILEHKEFIESLCLKYDNTMSNETLLHIKIESKLVIKNGDKFFM